MGGIEALVGVDHPELIPAIPNLLMVLYQSDILDEEFIQSWGKHVSKKYVDRDISKKVRKASEPFLKVSIFDFFYDMLLQTDARVDTHTNAFIFFGTFSTVAR